MSDSKRGLYGKYEVYKDGKPVEECFVLKPTEDSAALQAARTYISETENDKLAEDLENWLAKTTNHQPTRETRNATLLELKRILAIAALIGGSMSYIYIAVWLGHNVAPELYWVLFVSGMIAWPVSFILWLALMVDLYDTEPG